MGKRTGWRSDLTAYLEQIKAKPFAFSLDVSAHHDCAVGLAFKAIEIQTGLDLGEPFRGQYGDFLSGVKVYQRAGFKNLDAVLAAHFECFHPASAQFGDIASMQSEQDGWALGVVLGERIGVLQPRGYSTVPRSLALRTYRVK